MTTQKACTKCNVSKSLDEFHAGKRYKFGRQSWCKVCTAAYKRNYRAQNSDRIATQSREYYESNKERRAAYRRQYYQANKGREGELAKEWRTANSELKREIDRAYREANKDADRNRVRNWRRANPDMTRQQEYRRRASERAALGKFTIADIHAMLKTQSGQCVYCQTDISHTYTVDHIIPLSRGGSNWPDNLQLLCASCNSAKNDRTHDEFVANQR